MASRPKLDFFDTTKYLFLRELSEPRDNSLRLVVQEAVVNPSGLVRPHPELPELEELSRGASPIERQGDSAVTWQGSSLYLDRSVKTRGLYGKAVGSKFQAASCAALHSDSLQTENHIYGGIYLDRLTI